MNNKFDELAKGVAQSVTRREALKKFGLGIAGLALASFGLANKAEAARGQGCINACIERCEDYLVAQGATKAEAKSACQDNSCALECFPL